MCVTGMFTRPIRARTAFIYLFFFAPRPVRVCVVLTGEALTDLVVRPDWKVLQSRGVCYYPPSRQVQPTAVWREGFIHNYRLERSLENNNNKKHFKLNIFQKLKYNITQINKKIIFVFS